MPRPSHGTKHTATRRQANDANDNSEPKDFNHTHHPRHTRLTSSIVTPKPGEAKNLAVTRSQRPKSVSRVYEHTSTSRSPGRLRVVSSPRSLTRSNDPEPRSRSTNASERLPARDVPNDPPYTSSRHSNRASRPSSTRIAENSHPTHTQRRTDVDQSPALPLAPLGGRIVGQLSDEQAIGPLHLVHASETSPTLVYPSDKQPLIVPVNNGNNGWMVIPPSPRSKLRVTGPTGETTIEPQPSSKKTRQTTFGKLNFGFGRRSRQ